MEDVGDHHHDRGWEQLATRLRARLESTREAFPFAAAATAPAVVVPGKGASHHGSRHRRAAKSRIGRAAEAR